MKNTYEDLLWSSGTDPGISQTSDNRSKAPSAIPWIHHYC